MKTRWKIILALFGVVLISGLAGAVVGGRLAVARIHAHNNPERWNESVMHQLQHRLRLSPEETQKVQAHMDARVDELKALREETVSRTNDIIERLIADVDQELTPEQKAEFARLKEKRVPTTLDTLKVEPRRK
jgi:Spy/CpxP family protein refolding chaperone